MLKTITLAALTATCTAEDPRKEYFEKIGAQFAHGFLYGAKVGSFDEVDLFTCLQRETDALKYFYQADEELKRSLYKHDPDEAIHGLKELIGFIAIMANTNVPGRSGRICSELAFDGQR